MAQFRLGELDPVLLLQHHDDFQRHEGVDFQVLHEMRVVRDIRGFHIEDSSDGLAQFFLVQRRCDTAVGQ